MSGCHGLPAPRRRMTPPPPAVKRSPRPLPHRPPRPRAVLVFSGSHVRPPSVERSMTPLAPLTSASPATAHTLKSDCAVPLAGLLQFTPLLVETRISPLPPTT